MLDKIVDLFCLDETWVPLKQISWLVFNIIIIIILITVITNHRHRFSLHQDKIDRGVAKVGRTPKSICIRVCLNDDLYLYEMANAVTFVLFTNASNAATNNIIRRAMGQGGGRWNTKTLGG